jgi:DNA-binding GntR family transcriptional regulator
MNAILVRQVLDELRPGSPLTAKAIAESLDKPLREVREALNALGRNGSAYSIGAEEWQISGVLRQEQGAGGAR